MRILLRMGKGEIVLALISFILQSVLSLFLGSQYDMGFFYIRLRRPSD